MSTNTTNSYCSQKFWWLTVEPERNSMMSCCSASAHRIDLSWLTDNPGELFNTPTLVSEREQMLAGIYVPSCEATCWSAERKGLPSRRTIMQSDQLTHSQVHSTPQVLHINLGSDCNLTCSYCCKQYSTAWMRDIRDSGAYLPDDRYTLNTNDHIVLKLGQSIKNTSSYKLVLSEAKKFKNARVEITGGEPFLYNDLAEIVSVFPQANIFTGLGVDSKRLARILDTLPDTVTFTVSAETTGKLYEFNRYGNTWAKFETNLNLLKRFKYNFCSVISNLTIHGYEKFKAEFGTANDIVNSCTDPDYLSASVMDDISKQSIKGFSDTLAVKPTLEQKTNFKLYLTQFAQRRKLSLDVLPPTLVQWINE